jgi:hypothetical protein
MADPLAALTDACKKADGSCPGRTHFILHQTVDGNLTKEKIKDRFGGKKNKAHQYILKSGEVVPLWRLSQKDVYATKAETNTRPLHGTKPSFPLKGKMIHIEIDYEENGEPNDKQYAALCDLYIAACKEAGCVLTIVPHIEVDRGIKNGHNDPQNFRYNDFYAALTAKGIDMSRVPRFDNARYWGKPNYKTPFDTDTFSWPPKLSGNPHA